MARGETFHSTALFIIGGIFSIEKAIFNIDISLQRGSTEIIKQDMSLDSSFLSDPIQKRPRKRIREPEAILKSRDQYISSNSRRRSSLLHKLQTARRTRNLKA
jgi:hypothetical protein